MMELGSRGKLCLCGLGIFACYFYYGILQERITRGIYGVGNQQERFKCIQALVFFQCVVNYLFALVMSKTVLQQGEDTTRSSYYAISSLTYLLAMVTSNKALSWVNYPTQVVGKSCKPIPVMILGVLVGRKSYPLLKYLFILMIVVGVAIFMYKDKVGTNKSTMSTEEGLVGVGELLLVLSLTCDGLTGAVQERMKTEHQTKSGHMMMSMNKWSIMYLGITLSITGEGLEFISFISRHPSIIWQLASFSCASALGQFFIFMCVSEFGPLPCSIITTTRKFFTVLASVIIFGNTLIARQWVGTFLVFIGIFLDGMYGKQKPQTISESRNVKSP